ncbi:MAG: stage V sporulation protein AD, partial [Firmicutes bacterium]|nr:stage V sporulation protein AD [Bacillota bacterium]
IILQKMQKKELNNILFLATGALMSPTSFQQGETIPGIAHLVQISN